MESASHNTASLPIILTERSSLFIGIPVLGSIICPYLIVYPGISSIEMFLFLAPFVKLHIFKDSSIKLKVS